MSEWDLQEFAARLSWLASIEPYTGQIAFGLALHSLYRIGRWWGYWIAGRVG